VIVDPEMTHLNAEGQPLCGTFAHGVDALTEDPDKVDCPLCKKRMGTGTDITIHVCGPSTPKCRCNCGPDGPDCEHVWDGPWAESEDGRSGSVTCSRCGMWKMDHDLWVMP